MKQSVKIAILVINGLLCVAMAVCTHYLLGGWGNLVIGVCYALAVAGFAFSLATFFLKNEALFKTGFVFVCVVAVVLVIFGCVSIGLSLDDYPDVNDKTERIRQVIIGLGGWGYFVYYLIQVLQVVILPLPAAVCYIPGSLIWGPLYSTLIASAGVVTGSVIAYIIGKYAGKKAVIWIAGKETTEKYTAYLSKRGKVLFALMQLLPFFPDDITCMVAGLTGLNFVYYIGVIILVRPLVIAAYCCLGSGTLIPFSGWGIPVWIAIFAVCIVLAVLSFKYQDKFESWLIKKFGKKKGETEKANNVPSHNDEGVSMRSDGQSEGEDAFLEGDRADGEASCDENEENL